MRFWEIIADKLAETAIFEMAFDRKSAKDKITSLSPIIFKHLVKIFVFEAPHISSHWIKEIDTWLDQIDDINLKKNQNLDKNTLYDWLILDSAPIYDASHVNKIVRKMVRNEYPDLAMRSFDADEIANKVINIISAVCSDIAADKFDTIKDYL